MNKKLTPLEALDDLRNCLQAYYTMECVPKVDGNFHTIETALKALEIIKEKIDVLEIIRQGDTQFGLDVSKEEYNLLKEVLL